MNIIESIKEQMETAGINENFFDFYFQSENFKLKFFAIFISVLTIPLGLYLIFSVHHLPSLVDFLFSCLGIFVAQLSITTLLSFSMPITGLFFKTVSRWFPGNRTLPSLIDSTEYKDKIISNLFDNKEFMNSLLTFYSFLDKINFSDSYGHNEVNYKNKEIKENFNTLGKICRNENKKSFVSFIKSKFIHDYQTYSTNEKLISVMTMVGNSTLLDSNTNSNNSKTIQQDDLLKAMSEELSFRNKFKKVL